MKHFRYLLDPLCFAACALYALNRWLVTPQFPGTLLNNHFNDLLLIPAALPVVLFLHRVLGLRKHDQSPTPGEILTHLAVWSLLCEVIGPQFVPAATGDWRDVIAYTLGAFIAAVWWHRESLRPASRAMA